MAANFVDVMGDVWALRQIFLADDAPETYADEAVAFVLHAIQA